MLLGSTGVNKKIKLFDWAAISKSEESREQGCRQVLPIKTMAHAAKLSSLIFNPYIRQAMAGGDYEGRLNIWDIIEGKLIMTPQEHEKRVWSVDFCEPIPTRIASGGDDGKCK